MKEIILNYLVVAPSLEVLCEQCLEHISILKLSGTFIHKEIKLLIYPANVELMRQ